MSNESGTPNSLALLPDDIICELFIALADIDVPRGPSSPDDLKIPFERSSDPSLGWNSALRQTLASLRSVCPPSIGWIRLTHVSRRLRGIGIDMPLLWGRVVSIFPDAWETTLSRSKNAPLDLHLGRNGFDTYSHWPISIDALLARTRYFGDIIHVNQQEARHWWKNASLTLCLVNLQLKFRIPVNNPTALQGIGQITAPKLMFHGVYGGFIPFHAPSLRHLVVRHKVVWTTLLDSLRTCPLLETLAVDDTRRPRHSIQAAVDPVELMHLTTLRVNEPSSSSVLKFIDCLSIPALTRPQVYCASLKLFRRLAEHPTSSACNALNVTIGNLNYRTIAIEVNITRHVYRSIQAYRTCPGTGITFIQWYPESKFDDIIPEVFGSRFAPIISGTIDTLSFCSSAGGLGGLPPPILSSGIHLKEIGNKLCVFEGLKTIYVQRESAPILLAARGKVDKEDDRTEMLFPVLETVILDIFTHCLDFATWKAIVDVFKFRCSNRHPLQRLVLIGSRLCHLSLELNHKGIMELEIDLPQIEEYVGEIVDLRDGKCTCDNL